VWQEIACTCIQSDVNATSERSTRCFQCWQALGNCCENVVLWWFMQVVLFYKTKCVLRRPPAAPALFSSVRPNTSEYFIQPCVCIQVHGASTWGDTWSWAPDSLPRTRRSDSCIRIQAGCLTAWLMSELSWGNESLTTGIGMCIVSMCNVCLCVWCRPGETDNSFVSSYGN